MSHNNLRIIFAGTPLLARDILAGMLERHYSIVAVYTQPDRPAGRGRQLTASPVKLLAESNEIPVCQPKTLRSDAVVQALAAYNADLMVVVGYGLILPEAVLKILPLGCLNIHVSLLPRWRGAAPVQRAILAGDQQTGVTIMQMDAGLDTGPMWYQLPYKILASDTTASVTQALAQLGLAGLQETLKGMRNHDLQLVPQDDSMACYAHKIDKAEAAINWSDTAEIICRQVRAFNPFPIAYTTIAGQRMKIWQAQQMKSSEEPIGSPLLSEPQPGTIIHCDKNGLDVMTGDGILKITHCQLSGGKMLPVRDLLNSKKALFSPGTLLGEKTGL